MPRRYRLTAVAFLGTVLALGLLGSACGSNSAKERVPNVVGKSLSAAKRQLKADHLGWRVQIRTMGTPADRPGTVVAQTPRSGKLSSGADVLLVVMG